MSDVSYPVPIRDVITGGKNWGVCHLAEIFRRTRLKLVPDPPIIKYLTHTPPTPLNSTARHTTQKKEDLDAVISWTTASRREQENHAPQTSALYSKLRNIFYNRHGQNHKTMFVFINGFAELEFKFVERSMHDWTEHDRFVSERGGGYAIMAFNLDKPFEHQFPLHKYGHFHESNGEGLNYFSMQPLIHIADRKGNLIPAEAGKKGLHQIIAGSSIAIGWNNPDADKLPPKRRLEVAHLALV